MTDTERLSFLAEMGSLTKKALALADSLVSDSGTDGLSANERLHLHDVGIGLESALTHIGALLTIYPPATTDGGVKGAEGSETTALS